MPISGTVYKDYAAGIRIDAETSYATGSVAADAVSLGKVTNFSSNEVDATQRLLGIGEGRNETAYTFGNFDVTGTIEWIMLADMGITDGGSIAFLKMGVGKAAGAGTTASPYEISEVDAIDYTNMYSFAIFAQIEGGATDDVDQFIGCVVNDFTISWGVDKPLTCSLNWTGQKVASTTTISTAYVANTAAPWVYQQGTFKWGQTPTAVTGVVSGSITVNNNPLIYRSIGSRFIEKPEFGRRLYDFTVTVKMTSDIATAIRDDLYGAAGAPIVGNDPSTREADNEIALEFVESTGASGDKKLVFELDQCVITGQSKPIPLDQGIIEVTYTGFAKMAKPDSTINVFARYWTVT